MGSTVRSDYKHNGLNVNEDIVIEATGIIRKLRRHIRNDNCSHCRAVLGLQEEGAGNQPAPTQNAATQHHQNHQAVNVTT